MTAAYLEGYREIKLLLPKSANLDIDFDNVKLINNEHIELKLVDKYLNDNRWHVYYKTNCNLFPHLDYVIGLSNKSTIKVRLGRITRTLEFDEINYYDGPLGVEYHQEFTIFRTWSPVAKVVKLSLPYLKKNIDLTYKGKGLWETKLEGDLDGQPYFYYVRVNEVFVKVLDPYAFASTTNSLFNYVIDFNKTYQFQYPRPKFSGYNTDAVICEMHLKDFSYTLEGDESAYLKAFKEYDGVGINYLKDMGITHAQIMPVNTFYGVDESFDIFYNWGYNPSEYFSISGWFATKPNDAYNRINEFKMMIDNYHKKGILVNLDVVFNHVFKQETFSMNRLVPGYIFRTDLSGFMTNGSGCGNDIATEHKMISRFIVDNLVYFTKFYQIDGFRFDLMGLLDAKTLQTAYEKVKAINPQTIFYGEGWYMKTGLDSNLLASNRALLPEFGYFNDFFRDCVKGNPFNLNKGLATGGRINKKNLMHAIMGSGNPIQSLNFIECHDNYTIADQIDLTLPNLPLDKKIDLLRLGIGIMFVSQGMPFIHLGMEFGRSKQGISNSYKDSLEINKVDWSLISEYRDLVNSVKDLISIRKEIPLLRLHTKEEVESLIRFGNEEIFNYTLNNEYRIFIKDDYSFDEIYLKGTLIFDGLKKEEEIENLVLTKPGVYIVKTKEAF